MPKSSKHKLRVIKGGVLTIPAAEDRIRQSAAISAGIILTQHCRERMGEREITLKQIEKTLRKGQVAKQPKFNKDHEKWECEVQYHGSGTNLTVICALMEERLVIIAITVHVGTRY